MKTQSKEGLLLEAKLICDGKRFFLKCSIEDCRPFHVGPFMNIEKALKYMTMFQLGLDKYPH